MRPAEKAARVNSTPGKNIFANQISSRVEFRGDDGKGYRIRRKGGHYQRISLPLPHIRVVLRDEPFLLYKVSQVFDLYGVSLEQALITTTGNQVVDYFYLDPEEYERLRNSSFEEAFVRTMNSDLLQVAR